MNTATFNIELANAAKVEWTKIAGEKIETEVVNETIYAFGSEIACLRIFKAFKGAGRVEFSTNLNTWFFSKD